jgi:hypothetical protein
MKLLKIIGKFFEHAGRETVVKTGSVVFEVSEA